MLNVVELAHKPSIQNPVQKAAGLTEIRAPALPLASRIADRLNRAGDRGGCRIPLNRPWRRICSCSRYAQVLALHCATGSSPATHPRCLQWFAAVDTDRSGRISVNELQEALALGNLHFSLAVCAQMIRFATVYCSIHLLPGCHSSLLFGLQVA